MKDAVATMGGLLPDDAGGRDAVHVAVFSARAPVKVFPGQHVGLVDAESVEHGDMVVSPLAPAIGIVDPFLAQPAFPDARFWVYLYPRTITSLAHRWGHPSFENTAASGNIAAVAQTVPASDPNKHYATPTMALVSERWLRDWCGDDYDRPTYTQLMEAVGYMDGDEYLTIHGSDIRGDIPGEIWGHVENVLGRRLPSVKPTYFSCSC